MKRDIFAFAILCGMALFESSTAKGQTPNAVQSNARPFGANRIGLVMTTGSDARSATHNTVAPTLQTFANREFPSQIGSNRNWIDPSAIRLTTSYDVRVYFMGESTNLQSTMGFNTSRPGNLSNARSFMIFPNMSQPANGVRTNSAPLMPGDFVQLGTRAAGSTLDFWAISNGAVNPRRSNIFWGDPALNQDRLAQFAVYAMLGTPYLIIGFEETFGGGDGDYNDAFFAVDIGMANVTALVGAPEPGTLGLLGLVGVGGVFSRWRSRRRNPPATARAA